MLGSSLTDLLLSEKATTSDVSFAFGSTSKQDEVSSSKTTAIVGSLAGLGAFFAILGASVAYQRHLNKRGAHGYSQDNRDKDLGAHLTVAGDTTIVSGTDCASSHGGDEDDMRSGGHLVWPGPLDPLQEQADDVSRGSSRYHDDDSLGPSASVCSESNATLDLGADSDDEDGSVFAQLRVADLIKRFSGGR